MKKSKNWILIGLLGLAYLLIANTSAAQRDMTAVPITQQDPRLHIGLYHQVSSNVYLGSLTQDYRITIRNKTNDKLHIYVEYFVDLVCGKRNTHEVRVLNDGYVMKPGESIDRGWTNDGLNSYGRLLESSCPKETWRVVGKDKEGHVTYSLIKGMGYRIVKIVNLTEKERAEAAWKQQQELEKKQQAEKLAQEKKEAEVKKELAAKTTVSTKATESTKSEAGQGSAELKKTTQTSASNTERSSTVTTQGGSIGTKSESKAIVDDNLKSASQFKGSLKDVKEGEYFTDDQGGYFRKVGGNAQRVDKQTYDKVQADLVYARIAKQEAASKEHAEAVNQLTTNLTNIGANMLGSMREDRDRQVQREINSTSKANEALKNWKDLAATGNSEALKKVNSAYYTLSFYNKEEKTGWNGSFSQEQEKFLKQTWEKTKSQTAQDLLIKHYGYQKQAAVDRKKKKLSNGITCTILGGAALYGGFVGYDKLMQRGEDGEWKNEGLGTAALILGAVGGIGLGIYGIYDISSSFSHGKNAEGYKIADEKIKALKSTIVWQITPQYNPRFQAAMLNLKLTF